MGRKQFAVHRWLGVVVGVQLFLWCLGGFIFATHDIDEVRGADGRADLKANIDFAKVRVSPGEAARIAGASESERVVLRSLLSHPYYELTLENRTSLVDAFSGEPLLSIGEERARAIVAADRVKPTKIATLELLERSADSEYRGRPLPAWRVVLADAQETHLYVSDQNGAITARRNNAWRRFDFFWMLHTMDYKNRDNFNTPLLSIASLLAILTAITGITLWIWRIAPKRKAKT